MILTILGRKYKIDCGKGQTNYTSPKILEKLNKIIEWDLVKVAGDVPKEPYLTNKCLCPGDVITINNTIIAINSEDELVTIITSTGINSLKRIVEESILTEYRIRQAPDIDNIEWEVLDTESDNPTYDGKVTVDYPVYRLWKDIFAKDRGNYIKVKAKIPELLVPIDLVFGPWTVLYKSCDWDEDDRFLIIQVAEQIIGNFINKYDRILPPDESESEET